MLVQVKERIPGIKNRDNFTSDSIVLGNRVLNHASGVFEVDAAIGQRLVNEGSVEVIVRLPGDTAERAVEPTKGKERR